MKKIFLLLVFSLSFLTGFCQADRAIMQEPTRYRPFSPSQWWRITNNGAGNGKVNFLEHFRWIDSLVLLDTNTFLVTLSDLNSFSGSIVYPATRLPFGDGTTPGGVTSDDLAYDGSSFMAQGSGAGSGGYYYTQGSTCFGVDLTFLLSSNSAFSWVDQFNGASVIGYFGKYMGISGTDAIVTTLTGTGTQMVTADINGILSKQAIPTGTNLINGGANLGGLGTNTVGIVKDTLSQKIRFKNLYGTYGASVINRTDSIEIRACDTANITASALQTLAVANTAIPGRTYKITNADPANNIYGWPLYVQYQKGISLSNGNMIHPTTGYVFPVTYSLSDDEIRTISAPMQRANYALDDPGTHSSLSGFPDVQVNAVSAMIKMIEGSTNGITIYDNILHMCRIDGYEIDNWINGINGFVMESESWATIGITANAAAYYWTLAPGSHAILGDNGTGWYWNLGQYAYDSTGADNVLTWLEAEMESRFVSHANNTFNEYVTVRAAADVLIDSSCTFNEPIVVGEDSYLRIGKGSTFNGAINVMAKVDVVMRPGITVNKDITIRQDGSNVEDTIQHNSGTTLNISTIDYVGLITVAGSQDTIRTVTNFKENFTYRFYPKAGKTIHFKNGGNLVFKDSVSFIANGSKYDWIEFKSDSSGTNLYETNRASYHGRTLVYDVLITQVASGAPTVVNTLSDTTDFSSYVGGTALFYNGIGTYGLQRLDGSNWDPIQTSVDIGSPTSPGACGGLPSKQIIAIAYVENALDNAIYINTYYSSYDVTGLFTGNVGIDDNLTNTHFKVTLIIP